MLIEYRHIRFWLCSVMMLLCLACSSDSADDGSPTAKKPSQLEIYVYTPEKPVVTRTVEVEKIDPDENEKVVNTLQIWVFVAEEKTSGNGTLHVGDLVGYLSPQISTPSSTEYIGKYQLTVSELFVELHPKVNVYVVANGASTGLDLSSATSMDDLNNLALIQDDGIHDYFGLSSPMTTAVSAEGLPMSGVLKAADVTPSLPVLKVTKPVTVIRAVSKVRFVFSRSKPYTSDEVYGSNQELKITGISLDNGMIPKAEYLFLASDFTNNYHEEGVHNCHPVTTGDAPYISGPDENGIALSPLAEAASQIPEYENPSAYAYTGEVTGQDYENLINTGIEEGHLAEIGKFYIRESDKQVTGRIHYTIGNDATVKSSTFRMTRAGEFSRNHTWIVYGYFSAKELLSISSVNVLPWTTTYTDYVVPNW